MSKDPTAAELAAYDRFRKRIVDEDALISARMNWLVWAQTSIIAIWFTVLFSSAGNAIPLLKLSENTVLWFLAILPLIGLGISLFAFMSIRIALSEILDLRRIYKEEYPDAYMSKKVPNITGRNSNHRLGHVLPSALPFIYAIIDISMIISLVS